MRIYTFIVAKHEEYGTLGFRPSWYPAGDPLSGMAVAHDILEHFPKDTGTAEEEYQALGAALFIRGDSGYFGHNRGNRSPEENTAADLPMIWSIQSYVKPCLLSRDQDLMTRTRNVITHFKKELEYMEQADNPDEEDLEHIARWIAKGYQRAKKRYGTTRNENIAWGLFQPIEEQADTALKHAEEGMVLTVRVDFRRGLEHATVDCDYPTSFNE